MAEVIITLGVINPVISCIEWGSKIAHRLEYYLARTKPPPRIFVTLHDTMPLLITTSERLGTLALAIDQAAAYISAGMHAILDKLGRQKPMASTKLWASNLCKVLTADG